MGAEQRNHTAAATDVSFACIAIALIRRLLAIFDRMADFQHCKLAGGDTRQIGWFGWLAPPTGGQEFVTLAGVRQGARSRRPTDLHKLAQN